MNGVHDKSLSGNARRLRREMTKQERHLRYDFLKNLPIMVRRQKVIDSYIVDFYIAKEKLVIELDGSQHYEAEGKQKDTARNAFLCSRGLTVLRYSNADVDRNLRAVCEDIRYHLHLPEV